MVNNITNALGAYQQALSRIGGQIPAQVETPKSSTEDFKNLVKDVVTNAADLNKQAESMSIAAVAGKADIQDVVLAVANAEVALETVVAIRDTAVKAYKDIMSMPI